MLTITNLIAIAAVLAPAMVVMVVVFVLGWLAAGGRCRLGLHNWHLDRDWEWGAPDHEFEYCSRCGATRELDPSDDDD